MPSSQPSSELDARFPSGEWNGFFLQPDGARRYSMDMVLRFAEGSISGDGDDPVGAFSIDGEYNCDTSRCFWTKEYLGQHGVNYDGIARKGCIIGEWNIAQSPPQWCGPFFLWPRASGSQESLFERMLLEYELDDSFTRESELWV